MGPDRASGRAAAVVLATAWLAGCRPRSGAPADAAAPDAADAPEPRISSIVEAGPADDSIPQASSEELTVRARHLLDAIAKDESALATDILFPRDGWVATHDGEDPGKEWERRIATQFRRSLHALWRTHKDLERAQFVSLELGHTVVQVPLRRHEWTKPLWTVRASRITFVVDGRTRTLPIREMTAWRGAWYVTRLR